MPYELPGKGRQTVPCPVCGSAANVEQAGAGDRIVDCFRCGDYSVSRSAVDDCLPLASDLTRALAAHLIRKMQGSNRPHIESEFFGSLSQHRLPTPAEQSDLMLEWLGREGDGRPGKRLNIAYDNPPLFGIVGAVDAHDILWIVRALESQGLIGGTPTTTSYHAQLTPEG